MIAVPTVPELSIGKSEVLVVLATISVGELVPFTLASTGLLKIVVLYPLLQVGGRHVAIIALLPGFVVLTVPVELMLATLMFDADHANFAAARLIVLPCVSTTSAESACEAPVSAVKEVFVELVR